MINKLHNLAIVAASTALSLAVVEVAPVKAADFATFVFSFDSVYGELSFLNTELTGIGVENASLSELSSESEFFFSTNPYIIPSEPGEIDYLPTEAYELRLEEYNPVFTFEEGYLVGIELSATRDISDSNPDYDPDGIPGQYGSFQGSSSLSLLGDSYQASLSGVGFFTSQFGYPVYEYDEDGNVIGVDYIYETSIREVNLTDSGAISFETFDRIKAVPEPLTMIGAGTALLFGIFFKKKIGKKQQKDNLKA